MQLNHAKDVAVEYGKTLKMGSGFMYDLYDKDNKYVDSIFPKQLDELIVEDFIEFYLEDDYEN